MWRTNGNISGTTCVQNSTEWIQINPENLVYLPVSVEVVYDVTSFFFLKSSSNARKMESNKQFQSKQLYRESTDPEKDSCTSIDDDFVAECSSADNLIHTPAPSETSRSSARRRTRPRSGKRPLEDAMIEIQRKKLDLMQSTGNGREDWDTTYHFLRTSRG